MPVFNPHQPLPNLEWAQTLVYKIYHNESMLETIFNTQTPPFISDFGLLFIAAFSLSNMKII